MTTTLYRHTRDDIRASGSEQSYRRCHPRLLRRQDGYGTFYAVSTPNYSFAYDPATIRPAQHSRLRVTTPDLYQCRRVIGYSHCHRLEGLYRYGNHQLPARLAYSGKYNGRPGSVTGRSVLYRRPCPTGGPAPFDYRFQWRNPTAQQVSL